MVRALVLIITLLLPGLAQAQGPTWDRITPEGVFRASAVVDSVYIDRARAEALVGGGDFTAYLMARLGIWRLPSDFGYRVAVDTTLIRIGGRVMDLPGEARTALNPLVTWLAPETWLEAHVELLPAGPEAVRFHLKSATIQGVPVPETLLATVMAGVGQDYPALTRTGRDLLVQIPLGAAMNLAEGGVALRGP